MGAVGSGDFLCRVHRLHDRRPVGIEAPIPVASLRITPRNHEDLLALLDEVLDHAAPWRDIHDVVLVDHRWHHEQWNRAHLGCLRGVLNQFEHRGLQYDGPFGDGQVLPHRIGVGLDHRRHPRLRKHVSGKGSRASYRAQTAGVDQRLPAQRTDQRVVAGRQAFDKIVDDELHLLFVAPIQLRVREQLLGRLGACQIGLHDPVQQRILLPRRITEALVGACRSAVRLAYGDIAELTGQRANSVGHRAGVLSEVAGEAGPGGVRHHPAGERLRGAGEKQVEWRGQLVDFGRGVLGSCHGYRVLSVVGTVMSRFCTLPVGPFGRASTNQTWRGYL